MSSPASSLGVQARRPAERRRRSAGRAHLRRTPGPIDPSGEAMSTLRRCLRDYRELWRVWVPLLVLSALFAPILFAIPLVEKQFIDGVLLAQQLDALLPTVGMYADRKSVV